MALSSGNVSKHGFLSGEVVLPKKGILEKAAAIKRFEYSPLGSGLKKQTDIAKDEYREDGNREDYVEAGDQDKCSESNITQNFDALLKDIRNNGRIAKWINVESRGININLHLPIIKLLNAEETVLKKDYGFDKVCNIFNDVCNKHSKLNGHKPIASKKIDIIK